MENFGKKRVIYEAVMMKIIIEGGENNGAIFSWFGKFGGSIKRFGFLKDFGRKIRR